jgi:hypothetical protein
VSGIPAFASTAASSASIDVAEASCETVMGCVPGFENARAAAEPAVMKSPCTKPSLARLETVNVVMGPGIWTNPFGLSAVLPVFDRSPPDTAAARPGEQALPETGPARFAAASDTAEPSTAKWADPAVPPDAKTTGTFTPSTGDENWNVYWPGLLGT